MRSRRAGRAMVGASGTSFEQSDQARRLRRRIEAQFQRRIRTGNRISARIGQAAPALRARAGRRRAPMTRRWWSPERVSTIALALLATRCSANIVSPSIVGGDDVAVLVGAGDVAVCGSAGTKATAALLSRQPGTVFAAGDLAYPGGKTEDFLNCYDPTWGAHKERTRPAPGNHEYEAP